MYVCLHNAGIRALATGIGPLGFAALFQAVTRTDSPWGFHPGLVFWVSAAMTLIAAGIAASLDPNCGKPPPTLSPSAAHEPLLMAPSSDVAEAA